MISPSTAFPAIPAGLRDPLCAEYQAMLQSYLEHRWRPAELSGGLFCEIVYTILEGYASGSFAAAPQKPPNFVNACRALENHAHMPRSFQILIPRLLPALYEIRNNRSVGHVGGDVDPNHMDSTAVVGIASWIMAELLRVFHNLTTDQAQAMVDALVDTRIPFVWKSASAKRVLRKDMSLHDEVLLLLAGEPLPVQISDLLKWTGYKNKGYFLRLLRKLHDDRLVHLSEDRSEVQILPPGTTAVADIVGPET